MQYKSGLLGLIKLRCFCAFIIGVENESIRLDFFQQHHPRIWHAVCIYGRKSNRVGVIRLATRCLTQPTLRDLEGILPCKYALALFHNPHRYRFCTILSPLSCLGVDFASRDAVF